MKKIRARKYKLGFARQELWKRYRAGETTRQIAAALGCSSGTVSWHVRYYGGIEPAQRVRAKGQLMLAEREEISRGLAAGRSMRQIAQALGRCASTICREIERNGGVDEYRAEAAEQAAWKRARRPKPCLLAGDNYSDRLTTTILAG